MRHQMSLCYDGIFILAAILIVIISHDNNSIHKGIGVLSTF